MIDIDKDKLRKKLVSYWMENPSSISQLSKKLHIHSKTLKNFIEGEKNVTLKVLLTVVKFFKDEGLDD